MWHDHWMGDLIAQGINIGSISLRDIVLPGTHDSATFDISNWRPLKPYAQCQALDIGQQLHLGIRFLDLRFEYRHGDFFAHHSLVETNTTLEKIMGDISAFFTDPTHSHELLVLRVSHLNIKNQIREGDLLQQLTLFSDQINSRLACRPQPRSVDSATSQTLNQLLSDGKQIVVIFENQYFPDEYVEDNYPVWCNDNDSNGNRVLTMDQVWADTEDINDLEHKLTEYQNEEINQSSLFVLQAVLTPRVFKELEEQTRGTVPPFFAGLGEKLNSAEVEEKIEQGFLPPSIWKLSQENNGNLLAWIATDAVKRRLNIIFMNFVGQEFSQWRGKDLVDIVMEINKQKVFLSSL